MAYNMYDKNYGSGFTPENDNRPPEQRPDYQSSVSPTSSDRVNGEYHYSYGFQPAEDTTVHPNPQPSYSGGSVTPPPVQPPYQSSGSPQPPKPPKKQKKGAGLSGGKMIAMLLACLLVGGAAGTGGAWLMMNQSDSASQTQQESQADTPDTTQDSEEESSGSTHVQMTDRESDASASTVSAGSAMTPAQIYEAYANSVVSIEVQTSNGIGAGTGFVISEEGYILTCYHVVEGYQAISCTFADSTSYEAEYVGGDEDADLAVIKIDPQGNTLTPVVIGNSDQLQVGGTVTAIGNALGTFANTLTSGTVSGLDRALTMSDGTVLNVLQTDCTVNSGNSGGPLFNEYGEVIGVVNAKYSSSGYTNEATIEGIGFAIPINDAMSILDDLIEHGYITGKPYMGISVSTVSSITAQQYSNMVVGAYVRSVEQGSCAEEAGLQVGDIITEVDGNAITTYEELIDAKNTHRAGDQMTLTVYREGSNYTIVITLDEEQPESAAGSTEDSNNGSQDSSGYGYSYDPFGGYFGDYFGGGW